MAGRNGYEALVLLAALAAIRLSQGLGAEELELLSTFFEVLGDDLALLALRPGPQGPDPLPSAAR